MLTATPCAGNSPYALMSFTGAAPALVYDSAIFPLMPSSSVSKIKVAPPA